METYKNMTVKSLDEIEETFSNVEVIGDKLMGLYKNKEIEVSSLLVDVCENTVQVKDVNKMSHGFYYSCLHPITNEDGGTSLVYVYLMKEWVKDVE